MWMFRPPSCGTFGSGGIVLMSSGTNVFGSSCANRTRYSTPPRLLKRHLNRLPDRLVHFVRRAFRPTAPARSLWRPRRGYRAG